MTDTAARARLLVYESFVRRKQPGYVKWGYSRLFSWEDAREAANSALYRIYVRWDALLRSDSPDAYGFKILRDSVIDVLRARDRAPALPLAAFEETVHPIAGVPPGEVDQVPLRLDIHRAISELPDRQRTCVFLHYILGCPAEEIADITGLASSTVRSHLHAGRAALATLLGVPDDDPPLPEKGVAP
ncbi:RNA polymerase sigma factor [Streptomyces sp. NPDC021100]|uniref:RNA polymerase sigma factor n=1 Tax=Streptomyces sp. NPDC021100 TaxID=3365114 RepID=UPI0037AE4AE7